MRIISGHYRGRKLLPPEGRVTRPITDRVKESLFGILTGWMDGATVVDLFCGTGSLGLEALSRGAAHCWFADRDRGAIDRLTKNIQTLDVDDRCTIWSGDLIAGLGRRLASIQGPLDVAFLDPPYPMAVEWLQDPAAGKIAAESVFAPLAGVLAHDGVVVFRTPRELPCPPEIGGLPCLRRKECGTMALNFLGPDNATDEATP